jgi:hypothetical protein
MLCMSRWVTLLVGMCLVGCSGATPSVRPATGQEKFCVYVPRRHIAPVDLDEGHDGQAVAPAPPTLGAGSPAVPITPPPPAPLQGIPGEGLGNGIPRGDLRLVPQAGTAAGEAGASVTAGEALVTGGAVIAAAGSVALVCLTVTAVVDGTETPIDIADRFYGTHFGDAFGWIHGQYAPKDTAHSKAIEIDVYVHYAPNGAVTVSTSAPQPQTGSASAPHAPPSGWPDSQRDKEGKEKRGRIYVTYRKFIKKTKLYYSGRTSMVVDRSVPLDVQAELAVHFRDMNHHIDENEEPKNAPLNAARLDVFDVGTAIDYDQRYDDPAYWRIRGREQQMIDFYGGAQSDTGKPYRTENIVRAVAKDNPRGKRFHDAATTRWGQLHRYTGD